ncbi:MAG: Gfo/Idh/MocA family protein, partial [Candidatus Binatia bacterium]
VKIRSEYHLRRKTGPPPRQPSPRPDHGHVGIIGCGNFAFSAVAYYLQAQFGRRVIRAVMDSDVHRAASMCRSYGAAYFTADASEIFGDPRIDLVFVVSNHGSHAAYATAALRAGKHVHLEKPPATSEPQLRELCEALATSGKKLRLGFNRSSSDLGVRAHDALLALPGPAVMSWFVFAHDIPPGHWYLAPGEGGRVAGNVCHWIEFVYRTVSPESRYPITIIPARADVADDNMNVTYRFGDGTIASITFASRGESAEGIRERFTAQKAGLFLTLDDFETLEICKGFDKRVWRNRRRDHGHRSMIAESYRMARPGADAAPADVAYVWEIGELILKTIEALERQTELTVEAYGAAKR